MTDTESQIQEQMTWDKYPNNNNNKPYTTRRALFKLLKTKDKENLGGSNNYKKTHYTKKTNSKIYKRITSETM